LLLSKSNFVSSIRPLASAVSSALITAFLFRALKFPYCPFNAFITSSAQASETLVKYFKIA